MSERPLPRPVTVTDKYLSAILAELQFMNGRLEQTAVTPEPELVDIREPAPLGTPLPDGFPGKLALEEAGIVYLENVPYDGDSLVDIKGIGKATAGQILAELT